MPGYGKSRSSKKMSHKSTVGPRKKMAMAGAAKGGKKSYRKKM